MGNNVFAVNNQKISCQANKTAENFLSEKQIKDEKIYGLTNFGNTCFFNSIIQALYHCPVFRERIFDYKNSQYYKYTNKDNILNCLVELFTELSSNKRSESYVEPRKFLQYLRTENEMFSSGLQHDAHEFFNYLINELSDLIIKNENDINDDDNRSSTLKSSKNDTSETCSNKKSFVLDVFEGILSNRTTCLNCETVSIKEESFLDLSIDIEQDCSINHCLKMFSLSEMLIDDQKYYCESCKCKNEAEKRMLIKRPPKVLALHLKRFKYNEKLQAFSKLAFRVVFQNYLRLPFTSDGNIYHNCLYELVSFVVHCGGGTNKGHYITIIKRYGSWTILDDDCAHKLEAFEFEQFFGISNNTQLSSECSYLLFYQQTS